MKTGWDRMRAAARSSWNAILGIGVELALTAIIAGACFIVCFFWWATAQ